MILYVLVRRGGHRVGEVTKYVNRDATTISSVLSRNEEKLEREPEFCREIEKLARIV